MPKIMLTILSIIALICATILTGYVLIFSEIWKPTWMKKSKHVIVHQHKGYAVTQTIYRWTPMIGDTNIFGYGRSTTEIKDYSE